MLYSFLSWMMSGCYSLCHNYGAAIILFTFCSKLILLPVSLWTYMNSITMIRIQPDIYMLKVRYYGQNDVLVEEQAKLFKKEKYYSLASTIPLIIQMILLVGVVGAIQAGIDHPEIDMSFLGVDLGMIPPSGRCRPDLVTASCRMFRIAFMSGAECQQRTAVRAVKV